MPTKKSAKKVKTATKPKNTKPKKAAKPVARKAVPAKKTKVAVKAKAVAKKTVKAKVASKTKKVKAVTQAKKIQPAKIAKKQNKKVSTAKKTIAKNAKKVVVASSKNAKKPVAKKATPPKAGKASAATKKKVMPKKISQKTKPSVPAKKTAKSKPVKAVPAKPVKKEKAAAKKVSPPKASLEKKGKQTASQARAKPEKKKTGKNIEKTSRIYFSFDEAVAYLKNPSATTPISNKKPSKIIAQKKEVAAPKTTIKHPPKNRKHGPASIADILGFNPFKDKKVVVADNADKVSKKWKKFYNMLIELRDKIEAEISEHSQERIGVSSREDSGDLTTNSPDSGTDTFERDLALSLFSSERETLSEIELAIERILDGTYGICEITGKPIDNERLSAIPYTRYSLEGQKEMEKNKRVNQQRTNIFSESNDVEFGEEEEE